MLFKLEQSLKEFRMNQGRIRNVPLYCIFNNKTLSELVKFQPKTENELLKIKGVGQKKINEYK